MQNKDKKGGQYININICTYLYTYIHASKDTLYFRYVNKRVYMVTNLNYVRNGESVIYNFCYDLDDYN